MHNIPLGLTAPSIRALPQAQVGFASRDKAAVEALAVLPMEHDALLEQQTHWEDFHHVTENQDHLSVLITRFQTNELVLKEPHHIRDRSKALEAEHTTLQWCCKDQETRAAEWEQHANEHEAMLTEAQVALENAKDRAAQLKEEHLKARAAEEQRATVRFFCPSLVVLCQPKLSGVLWQDHESKLHHQVAALEAHVAQQPFRLPSRPPLRHPHCPVQTRAQVQYVRAAPPRRWQAWM